MGSNEFHIVFAGQFDEPAVERMRRLGRVTLLDRPSEAELLNIVGDCDALLVRTSAQVTRAVLEASSRLKVVGRAGVGLENIDVEAARERGVAVVHTPNAATDAVADLTVGLLICLLRDVHASDTAVRDGRFRENRKSTPSREMAELTIGIVGMGRIGQAVARRCHRGFGMRVIYNDILPVEPPENQAVQVEKRELFHEADVVSLHVPLTAETQGMIDDEALRSLKPEALLINTARGAVVDSLALARRLCAGTLGGAALDVVEPEPLPDGHPLLSAPRTLFTAHIGARSHRGQSRMSGVVEDVERVLTGEKPIHPA